jgi:endonuclease/exonuclease/phosphatase family metal-dependent hydrolase
VSVKSRVVAATGILTCLGLVALMLPVLFLAVLGSGASACTPATQITYTGPVVGDLTPTQMQRAASIVAEGRRIGIPDQGIVVALATASQESGLRVYANDGQGGDLAPDQRGIAASLDLRHDAVGTDHGSLGVFQQHWPRWGTMAELMDPATSARKFYEALLRVHGWQSLPVTVAAQRVQRSAYPDGYADDEPLARQLLEAITNAEGSGVVPATAGGDRYQLGSVQPQLRALVNTLAPMFGITTVGGYRVNATDPQGHPAGLAADLMVAPTAAGKAEGDALAEYAKANADRLGIDYIIWWQRIWSSQRAGEGWRPMADRGSATANHRDHVHINVLPGVNPVGMGLEGGTGPGGLEIERIDGVYVGGHTDCVIPASATGGSVVFPLPADSGYVNQNNFGQHGGAWSRFHTGNDYSVACGTPVLAATSGTVQFDSSQSGWAGPNFVRVSTGSHGSLATWYAHMQTRTVSAGQRVTAGQHIGTVGNLGNSRGCHLHFEVHPRGGRIYEDPVDPVPWLAANLGRNLTVPVSATTGGSRTVVTFNALGHSHTAASGDRPGWPDSPQRTRGLAKLLETTQPDLVGLQEFQGPQQKLLRQLTGTTWGRFGDKDNVVIWRRTSFEPVTNRTIGIPYFNGKIRQMPVVTLRDRASGKVFTVINVHNPASGCASCGGNNDTWRRQALQREREEILQEQAAGRAVLLLGDLNDHRPAFCRLTAGGLMTAANGGSNNGTCRPPAANMGIDWIFGAGIAFADYNTDPSTQPKRISDHPWVAATFAVGSTVSAPPAGPDSLTVLSYSIKHRSIAKDGPAGLDALAQEITNSGAMVIALQAADTMGGGDFATHVKELAATLRMQFAYANNGTWNGRDTIDNAILTKYSIVDAENTSLPGSSSNQQPPGLLRVTVDLGETGRFADVYATHLHNASGIRVDQAEKIVTELDEPECTTVLMGGINTTPGAEPYGALTSTMRDAFGGRFGADHTLPLTKPRRRINYIFHDPGTSTVDAMVMPAGASDPRAVRATLRYDPERSCG